MSTHRGARRSTRAKTYITSGTRADFVVTAVRTGGDDLKGAAGVSLLVIPTDTPGFHRSAPLEKLGWRASDTAELTFTDCRVPVENLVGAEHDGFAQIAIGFVGERAALAAQGYSHAQRCLDLTLDWVRERETFGRPLLSRQAVQNTVTEMARRIDVARTYTHRCVDLAAAGHDAIAEVCFAKNTAVECAEWVANEALQLFGGLGYMAESEVSRQYRDVRLLVERYELPRINAVNFVIDGLLGKGVAHGYRWDPQAKGLAEWLRSRLIDVPDDITAPVPAAPVPAATAPAEPAPAEENA